VPLISAAMSHVCLESNLACAAQLIGAVVVSALCKQYWLSACTALAVTWHSIGYQLALELAPCSAPHPVGRPHLRACAEALRAVSPACCPQRHFHWKQGHVQLAEVARSLQPRQSPSMASSGMPASAKLPHKNKTRYRDQCE
jgi:hypothetical protein